MIRQAIERTSSIASLPFFQPQCSTRNDRGHRDRRDRRRDCVRGHCLRRSDHGHRGCGRDRLHGRGHEVLGQLG